MPRTLLALVLVFWNLVAFGVELTPGTQVPESSGPWVVRAYFTEKAQLHVLARRTAPWEVRHDQGYAVVEVPNRFEYSRLVADGFKVSIDPALTTLLTHPSGGRSVPGFACYRTVEETKTSMQSLVSAHPTLASLIDIGDSWEKQRNPSLGYDLNVLKLGNSAIGYLDKLAAGKSNNVVDGDTTGAQKIVSEAIKQVSSLRGRLGAFQKNTVGSTIRSLGISVENIAAAQSVIRDSDFATETAALTRSQIMVQASTNVLSLANQQPQSALSLLG